MNNLNERNVKNIVNSIIHDYEGGKYIDKINMFDKPDRAEVEDIIYNLFQIVFPGYFRKENYRIYLHENTLSVLVEDVIYHLNKQVRLALPYGEEFRLYTQDELAEKSEKIVMAFFAQLPKVRRLLDTDLQAAYDGDPAAKCKEEIILAYPGLQAIAINRLAHELHVLNVPLLPRLMTEYAHKITGVDIHPGATIGEYFFIDHATGIVVGETTTIGNHVKLYQGVTLGALSTSGGQSLRDVKRHPTIEDNVTIYSGASILGGNTVIGEGSVIGGNVFITHSIPKYTRVSVKNQELDIKNKKQDMSIDSFDWVI